MSLVIGLGNWALVSFVLISLLGNTGSGGFGLTVIPIGIWPEWRCSVVSRLRSASDHKVWASASTASLIVLTFAFISLAGLANPVEGRSTSETVVRFILIAIVVLLPTGELLVELLSACPDSVSHLSFSPRWLSSAASHSVQPF